MRRSTGFTLIELMIAVAIVAILAAVALPSYTDYVKRGRITDAVSALAGQRVKMEQFFQDNRTYVGACASSTIAPLPTATTNFVFSCPTLGAANYSVEASGVGSMAAFKYSINDANQHLTASVAPGWSNPGNCWVLKKDGSC